MQTPPESSVLRAIPSRTIGSSARGICALILAAAGLLTGCGDPAPAEAPNRPVDATVDSSGVALSPSPGAEVFDRQIVFLSSDVDSTVTIPWFFRSSSTREGIAREETVRLSRGGEWELLADHRVEHPASRSPWRIVPGGPTTGLVVGLDDRLEALVYRDLPRELELFVGNLMTEWARPGEATVRLHEGEALFPSGPVEGIVLDINRRWEARDDMRREPGDWVFVRSDEPFQLYLEERVAAPDPLSTATYRGWTRLAFRDRPWDSVEVTWTEVGPYEPARRDVPLRWVLATPDGSLSGELTAADSHLETGSSDGPILPISGVIEVLGTIRIDREEIAVSGLVHHVQR